MVPASPKGKTSRQGFDARDAFQHLPLGCVIVDRQMRIVFLGGRLVTEVIPNLEEAVGQTIYIHGKNLPVDYGHIEMAFVGAEFQTLVPRASHVFETTYAPIGGGPGTEARHVSCVFTDSTRKIESDRLYDLYRSEFDSAKRLIAIGEVMGGLAHELNNPLTIVTGKAEMMLSMLDEGRADPVKMKSYTTSIQQTAKRIAKIIKSMSAAIRDSEREMVVASSLWLLCSEAALLCEEKRRGAQVDFRFPNFPQDLQVLCRPTQLIQVFLNLMANAVDAVRHLDERWLEISVGRDAESLLINFTDSGPGIPENLRFKIMQPFFTTKDVGQGTGLGLSIVTEILRAMNGRIFVDGTNAHTRFVVALPLNVLGPA